MARACSRSAGCDGLLRLCLAGLTGVLGWCPGPLVVECGTVGYADGEVVSDEADRDQLEVVAEGVVEVERGLARGAGPGRPGDDDAMVKKVLLPPEEMPRADR